MKSLSFIVLGCSLLAGCSSSTNKSGADSAILPKDAGLVDLSASSPKDSGLADSPRLNSDVGTSPADAPAEARTADTKTADTISPDAGMSCSQCQIAYCSAQTTAAQNSSQFVSALLCATGCTNVATCPTCQTKYPEGMRVLTAGLNCISNNCSKCSFDLSVVVPTTGPDAGATDAGKADGAEVVKDAMIGDGPQVDNRAIDANTVDTSPDGGSADGGSPEDSGPLDVGAPFDTTHG
jgi:hypothetical protein